MDSRHINLIKHAQLHMKSYLRQHDDKGMPLVVCSFQDANDYLLGCLSTIPFKDIRLYSANLLIKDFTNDHSVAVPNPSFNFGDNKVEHAVILVLRQAEHQCLRAFISKCLDHNIELENISILSPCLGKDEYIKVCHDFDHEFSLLDNSLVESEAASSWRKNNVPPGPFELIPNTLMTMAENKPTRTRP